MSCFVENPKGRFSLIEAHMKAAKAQMSLHKCAVSPEPSLLAYTKKGCILRFRPKFTCLYPLDGCTYMCIESCKKTCHRGCANNKGADQPVYPCSLIRLYVIRLLESNLSKLAIRNFNFLGLRDCACNKVAHPCSLISAFAYWKVAYLNLLEAKFSK